MHAKKTRKSWRERDTAEGEVEAVTIWSLSFPRWHGSCDPERCQQSIKWNSTNSPRHRIGCEHEAGVGTLRITPDFIRFACDEVRPIKQTDQSGGVVGVHLASV